MQKKVILPMPLTQLTLKRLTSLLRDVRNNAIRTSRQRYGGRHRVNNATKSYT